MNERGDKPTKEVEMGDEENIKNGSCEREGRTERGREYDGRGSRGRKEGGGKIKRSTEIR